MNLTKVQKATIKLLVKGYNAEEISEARGTSVTNTYQVLLRLVKCGYVKHKERRESVYEVTEDGLKAIGELFVSSSAPRVEE